MARRTTSVLVPEGLIDEHRAAKQLGVNYRTLRNWRTRNTGPRYYPIGRHRFYKESDIRDYIEKQCVIPTLKGRKIA